jgi:hypothetical protein
MEVHAPHGSVSTWKDFLLASISAGRIQMQVAKQLSEEYGKVLGHRE